MTTDRRRELARRGTCPGCGDEYKRLAIHWTGSCSPPALSSAYSNLVAGLLLGGGRVAGNSANKHFQLTTQWRPFAVWVFNELGWLAATLVRKNPPSSDHDDRRPPAQHYVVRTHAHPALTRFRAWYSSPTPSDDESEHSTDEAGNEHEDNSQRGSVRNIPAPKDLPAGRLTPRVGRAWYAVAGRLLWGDAKYATTRQARFSARDDTRATAIMTLLKSVNLAPTRTGQEVELPPKQVTAWLDWIGEPVPGVSHKWAATSAEYKNLKRDAEAVRARLWYHPNVDMCLS
jgi:hypothetical protein